MLITERETGDEVRLRALARAERDAEQKDRNLAALHAASGAQALTIAWMLCRSRAFVQRWAYAYRDGGIDALRDKPRGGSRPKIRGAAAQKLKARLDAGPTSKDKVCTLRGKDVQRILREELGAEVSLSSVYRTLHSMGYSCLAPRPRHESRTSRPRRSSRTRAPPLCEHRPRCAHAARRACPCLLHG